MNLNQEFWSKKYSTNKIGWNLGEVSPPLKAYFDELENKEVKILIPGGGNSYKAGFSNKFYCKLFKNSLNFLLL